MRLAFDSNILIYAVDTGTPAKHGLARDLLERAYLVDAILVTQTLGEYLSVFMRKYPSRLLEAQIVAELWLEIFPLAGSTGEDVIVASQLALKHKLQYWDSLIVVVASAAGASYLFSEDMHDGLAIDGLTVVNPFNPANAALIEALLTPTGTVERP